MTANRRARGALLLLVGTLVSWLPATAAPRLRGQVDQGGVTRVLEFQPVADPYGVEAIPINDRFGFKAVLVGDARRVAYVKIYVYARALRQPVLLHLVKYLDPVAQPDPAASALTGLNFVYSPPLEQELQYGCALAEIAP